MTLFLLVAEYFLQLIFCTTTNNMKLIRDIQTFLTDVQTENTLMKRHLARKRVRNTTDQSSLGSHCFHIVPIIVDFSAN